MNHEIHWPGRPSIGMRSLEEPIVVRILSRLPFRPKIKSMRVCRIWRRLVRDQILAKETSFGIKTSLEPNNGSCPEEGDAGHTISCLFITDLKEKHLLNQMMRATDFLPSLQIIFVSPQILLRLDRIQQDSFATFLFDSYGNQMICLQFPSFRVRTVEPLPQLKHLTVHSLAAKVIKALEKSATALSSLEVMTEVKGETLLFLPRGIKRLKLRLRDESGSQLLSSGASQSVQDLHLITVSDICFGGRPRSLPKLKKLKLEANLNAALIENLALFLASQQTLTHVSIGFISRSSFSFNDNDEGESLAPLVQSLRGLEFLRMMSPSIDSQSLQKICDNNNGLTHIELSGRGWDDSCLESLSQLKDLKHLSLSIIGDSFTEKGMRTFISGMRHSLEYLLLRDINDPSILTKDIKDMIKEMVDAGSLKKVLLCDHINWGFMII